MQDQLKIAGIQVDLEWENIQANLTKFQEKIEQLSSDVDLIVLPEMFSTGFTMHPQQVAETEENSTALSWMKTIAKQKQVAITGSLVIKDNNNFANRLFFVFPDGAVEKYDKRHSFTLSGEHKVYKAGNQKLIVNFKGWKICPLVCYDLRFPVWSRNTENYDLLVYVANWPKTRVFAWDVLLKARAIENMSYCIGVNRVGKDENNYEFSGHTAAYNYLGETLAKTNENEEGVFEVRIDKNKMQKVREKLNFLNDKDNFTINN